jgi:diguanylate cyclase (GGDEF)-like protein/PAS domain S-box-containing protein
MIDFAAAPSDLYLGACVAIACGFGLLAMHRLVARSRARASSKALGPGHEANLSFEGLFFVERGVIADVNVALCSMLGRARDEIIGAKLTTFFTPECEPELQRVARERNRTIDAELVLPNGGQRDVDVAFRSIAAGQADVSVVAVRDITDRKRAERRNQLVVLSDPLTGVGNRPLFHERLRQATVWAQRTKTEVAVISIDVGKFKAVADRMGHNIGHGLLIEIAERLCDATRQIDTVARMGDSEFAVIATLIRRPEDVLAMVRRLLGALNEPYNIEGYLPDVRVSLGIAMYPSDASRPDSLLQLANLALVRARHDGGRQFCFFTPEMDTRLEQRGTLQQDLRAALDRGELDLHYQGIFDATSQALRGHEALLRWHHPSRGCMPPREIIALAEECGLIHALGDWVLKTACAWAATWAEPLTISVNLSPAQFKKDDLAERILAILADRGLAPERLELEIPEAALLETTDDVLAALRTLKQHGVRIALDDFGTGYSSLGNLRRFTFDALKIDRSVIAGLGVDPEADTTVRTVLALGRTLDLEIVAEGVETRRQLTRLAELGCDKVQGFLLGRPAPDDACAAPAAERMAAA